MLNSVQLYLQNQFQGQCVTADYPQGIDVVITPPNPGNMLQPTMFVWGGKLHSARQAGSRAVGMGGYYKFEWDCNLWLMVPDQSDYANADQAFPVLVDAVIKIMQTTQMPTVITDPVTQLETQIISFGEIIDLDYLPVLSMQDQSMLLYEVAITARVTEKVQFS